MVFLVRFLGSWLYDAFNDLQCDATSFLIA